MDSFKSTVMAASLHNTINERCKKMFESMTIAWLTVAGLVCFVLAVIYAAARHQAEKIYAKPGPDIVTLPAAMPGQHIEILNTGKKPIEIDTGGCVILQPGQDIIFNNDNHQVKCRICKKPLTVDNIDKKESGENRLDCDGFLWCKDCTMEHDKIDWEAAYGF